MPVPGAVVVAFWMKFRADPPCPAMTCDICDRRRASLVRYINSLLESAS